MELMLHSIDIANVIETNDW
jgi:hypothetical protein